MFQLGRPEHKNLADRETVRFSKTKDQPSANQNSNFMFRNRFYRFPKST